MSALPPAVAKHLGFLSPGAQPPTMSQVAESDAKARAAEGPSNVRVIPPAHLKYSATVITQNGAGMETRHFRSTVDLIDYLDESLTRYHGECTVQLTRNGPADE